MRNKSLPSKRSIITSYKIYQLVQTTLLQVIYQTYVKGSYKNQQTNRHRTVITPVHLFVIATELVDMIDQIINEIVMARAMRHGIVASTN